MRAYGVETHGYADPTGRVGQPHPAVAVGLLLSCALLFATLAALGQIV
jgi:hypothetical protein